MDLVNVMLPVLSGLGLLGGIGLAIKAVMERKAIKAKANNDDANATAIVVAAARELVDPLRQELAEERRAHSLEIEEERVKVRRVRRELDEATEQLSKVRTELSEALQEMNTLRQEMHSAIAEAEQAKAISRALEAENHRLRAAQNLK